jgi:ubiquinone/menaquinone biosynthesis C-methylase UbiE
MRVATAKLRNVRVYAIVAVLAATAVAQTQHQHHPPADAAAYAKILEDPQRDVWQLPQQVIMALELKPQETIADIGAGSGYFTRRLARHAKKVYAVDIDSKLLEIVRKSAPANVETVLAAPDDPKLPDASVDTIFFCDVLHHIENRPGYYARLAKALKPGGRIVNIDFHKKPTPFGPPEAMRISEEDVIREFEAAGFRRTKSVDILPYQYFLIFQRP